MVNGLKKKTVAESYAVDCRPLPEALDESGVDMPLVDLVAMATRTVQAMVMVSVMHGIILFWALLPVIRCHFVLNFYSMTNQVVALKRLKCPVGKTYNRSMKCLIFFSNFSNFTFSSKSDELLFFAGELCSELELVALILVSFFVVRSSILKNDGFERVLRRSVAETSPLRT